MKKSVEIGKKYNKLLVLKEVPHKEGRGIHKRFLCRCDCGKEKIVQSNHLLDETIKSCGCLVNGKSRTNNLYNIYKDMKRRCYNKNRPNYKYYGGKGIIVCDEWLKNYSCFKKWAFENGYFYDSKASREERLSLDRINNKGNYEPQNCRWISFKENRERRNN